MFRKFAAFLLAVLCTAPLFAACSDTDTDTNVQDTTSAAEAETTAPETTRIQADLPDEDFGGKELRIYTWSHEDTKVQNDFWTEGETGEPLNDAVFQRNAAIEERYNVKIKNIEEVRLEMNGKVNSSILAGDDLWDVLNDSVSNGNLYAQAGHLYELTALDYFDFDAQWWDQRFIKDMTIGNLLYQAMGEFNTMSHSQTWGFIFNKKMASDFSLDNLYDLVRNGTWTIDVMFEMMQTVAADTNGDGVMDQNDRWGLFTESSNMYQHMLGAGEAVAVKDADDMPVISINNERAISVMEKAYNIMAEKKLTFSAADWSHIATSSIFTEYIIPMFMDDQGLFYFTGIGNTFKHLREMESPYGVVPNPKYNEEQEEYFNGVGPGWATTVAIPVTCAEPEFASFLLEALAAESVETVTEVYYNILFENKGLRDEDSIEMVELIIDTRIFDIGYLNNWGLVVNHLSTVPTQPTFDFVSRYASIESAMQTEMEKTIETYEQLAK